MSNTPLRQFHRGDAEPGIPLSSKLTAIGLTAGVYAVIAVMASQHGTYTPPRRPQPSQVAGAMAPVLAPDKTAGQPSRLSWFLAEPPSEAPSSSQSSSGSGPTIGFTFGARTGIESSGTRVAGACYDAAWAKAVNQKILSRTPPQKRDGVAFVRFVVRRDGRLNHIEIVKSSGDKNLDDAAYRMVHDAQPLPRIPRWMQMDQVDAILPIAFGAMAGKFKPSEGNCAPDPVLNRET